MSSTRIFTVSELNASIRGLLEVQFPFVSVAGEISNLRQPMSGHCYFTLKDDQSQIRAVLFKMQQRYLPTEPADGRMAICRGRISVYEPRGEYQLIVDTVDFHGTGIMQLEFERLKQKLAAEGLFDRETKKPLPFFPEHVTLVTSPRGAAVHDFIRVARTRCPQVKIAVYPVSVQGDTAAAEMVKALADINEKLPTDVIVLCRGGGSVEDLHAFNEEKLARAIHGSTAPVVSAVGHEIDFTIADFAADLRAPTPSGAAEIILPDTATTRLQVQQIKLRQERFIELLLERSGQRVATCRQRLAVLRHPLDHLAMKLDHAELNLHRSLRSMLLANRNRLGDAAQRLSMHDPATRLHVLEQKLAGLRLRLFLAARSCLKSRGDSLAGAAALLDAVSPLATLARGYAIARTAPPGRNVITDAGQVKTGEKILVTLYRGSLECRIEKTGENRLKKAEREVPESGRESVE